MLCKNSQEEKSSTWLCAVITISSGPGGLYIPELPSQGSAYRCATSTSGTGGVTPGGLGPHRLSSPTEAKVTDSHHHLRPRPPRERASTSATDAKGVPDFSHPSRRPQ